MNGNINNNYKLYFNQYKIESTKILTFYNNAVEILYTQINDKNFSRMPF